jgi:eukaryotic-like serine/threonine-protein kinase
MQDVNLVLADRYEARERLGSGAGAGVEEYLGRDLRLARPVVIQVIRGAGKDGFAPQARLMASLDHPAVASVYDWGQQEGLAYLIREYVPGQNLGRLLIERGVLPVTQAAGIGAEVAAALAAAHRIGLAHGSLDAADVILGHQRVTVVGFGAAWMREAAGAAEGPVTGEGPGRAAPADPGAQGDLRALGGMLYQMVTGAPPEQWPVVTPMARAGRLGGPGSDAELLQVIQRLMASDPGDRYRAAEAVRADLLHLTYAPPAPPPSLSAPATAPAAAPSPGETTEPVRVPADAQLGRASTRPAARAVPRSAAQAGLPGGEELDGPDRPRRRRRRRAGTWMGVILGLALLGGAIAGGLVLTGDPGERVTVPSSSDAGPSSRTTVRATTSLPDVVGLDAQAATSKLELAGFVANISRQPSDQTPGVVTSQSPAAGERPPRGAIVFLTVSSGPEDSTVPSGPGAPPPTTAAQASP